MFMKKVIIINILAILSLAVHANEGQIIENFIIKSAILHEDMKCSIYLPPGYNLSVRSYPVTYLLHGFTDDQTAWTQFGEVQHITDNGIRDGKIASMIIVMPDAKKTYYMNNIEGKYSYEDYFFKELIPYIEGHYRCRAAKEFRAICGLSMGGFGSLLYSLHHPNMFSACSALSPAVRTDNEIDSMDYDEFMNRYSTALGDVKDTAKRITNFWNNNSILYMVQHMPENQKNKVRFYIDCGDDDFLFRGNSTLHMLMRENEIEHEYRVRDGGHNWAYWRGGLTDALAFISESFRR